MFKRNLFLLVVSLSFLVGAVGALADSNVTEIYALYPKCDSNGHIKINSLSVTVDIPVPHYVNWWAAPMFTRGAEFDITNNKNVQVTLQGADLVVRSGSQSLVLATFTSDQLSSFISTCHFWGSLALAPQTRMTVSTGQLQCQEIVRPVIYPPFFERQHICKHPFYGTVTDGETQIMIESLENV